MAHEVLPNWAAARGDRGLGDAGIVLRAQPELAGSELIGNRFSSVNLGRMM